MNYFLVRLLSHRQLVTKKSSTLIVYNTEGSCAFMIQIDLFHQRMWSQWNLYETYTEAQPILIAKTI